MRLVLVGPFWSVYNLFKSNPVSTKRRSLIVKWSSPKQQKWTRYPANLLFLTSSLSRSCLLNLSFILKFAYFSMFARTLTARVFSACTPVLLGGRTKVTDGNGQRYTSFRPNTYRTDLTATTIFYNWSFELSRSVSFFPSVLWKMLHEFPFLASCFYRDRDFNLSVK